MRKSILILTFLTGITLMPSLSLALSCTISTSCNAITVFKISSLTNAHAELPTQTNYGYYVCCNEAGLGNSCSGTYTTVIKLSSTTNAHVEEKTYTNYPISVCLSIANGNIDCQYANNNCNNLGSDYVCLASISSSTNAHVGECSAYPRKICCKATVSGPQPCLRNNPTVQIIPQTQSTNNPGTTLTYTVSVTNNDNSACGSSTFSLSVTQCPSGWTCSLSQNSVTISPGSTDSSTTISITSPSTASSGTYSFTVRATNSGATSYYGEGSGNYVINPPNTYTLTVETKIDVLFTSLPNIKVNVSNNVKYTDNSGIATYSLSPGTYTITAENFVGNNRPFSHFWDHDKNVDCNQNDALDTSTNPYTFTMASCERTITIWYKVFTHFENSAHTQGEIDYDGTKISGYLLREDNQPLHIDVSISLSYYDGSWHPIASVIVPSSSGYFEYSWTAPAGATKIKAEFIPQDWFYVGSSAEKAIVSGCSGNLILSISGSDTCTVGAEVQTTNCDGKNFEVRDESGNLECSGIISGNSFSFNCPSWQVSSNGGTTYKYDLYIDNVLNDTKQVTCNPSAAGCSGNIILTLSSTHVPPNTLITPSASGLSNCDGKTVTFRESSCSGPIKSSCIVSGNGCTGNDFNAPSSDGSYTYYACIDKNNDNDFSDPGEQDSENLQVDSSLLADFKAWLGIDSLSATLGQTFPVSIYIKNTGSVTDSYSLSVSSSSNVQTKLWDSKISDVLPNSVVSTKVEIKPLAVLSGETVDITITSSQSSKTVTLQVRLNVGSSNMSDVDAFSIILLVIIGYLIFVKSFFGETNKTQS
jgi:hypothetical protein